VTEGVVPSTLSRLDLDLLREMIAGRRPWSFDHTATLLLFALFTTGPESSAPLPGLSAGDAYEAIDGMVAMGTDGTSPPFDPERFPQRFPWRFDPGVDGGAFEALGFADVSQGIASIQRRNREAWWEHGRRKQAFIERVVDRLPRTQVAVVLGAGHAFGLPLESLARRFQRLILVDIDREALERTASTLVRDPGLRPKVELRVFDLTGVSAQTLQRARAIIDSGPSATEAVRDLVTLLDSYHLSGKPRLLGSSETADLLVSDLVLTQLGAQNESVFRRLVEASCGPIPEASGAALNRACGTFAQRLRQDHIAALCEDADAAVLISDVLWADTVLDAAGREAQTGAARPLLGTPDLRDRIPRYLEVLEDAAWIWRHVRPRRPGEQGTSLSVQALRLSRRA
jgi:hypothetical protein